MTLEQQHELFLKELAKKSSQVIRKFLFLESLAKSVGHDFFGFVKDEKVNIRNNAILRAAYDCMSNLQLQSQTNIIFFATKEASETAKTMGDIGQAFTQMCLKINDVLKDEFFYSTKRDNYLKQNLSSPRNTYEYSFGKRGEVHRQIIASLLNKPQLKKIFVLSFWINIDSSQRKSKEERTKYAITEMARVPAKSEAVHRIFDQSVNETVTFIDDFLPDEIFPILNSDNLQLFNLRARDWFHYRSFLNNRISSIMFYYPDLATIFTAFIQEQSGTSDGPSSAQEPSIEPIASETPIGGQTASEPSPVGSHASKVSFGRSVSSEAPLGGSATSPASTRGPTVTHHRGQTASVIRSSGPMASQASPSRPAASKTPTDKPTTSKPPSVGPQASEMPPYEPHISKAGLSIFTAPFYVLFIHFSVSVAFCT